MKFDFKSIVIIALLLLIIAGVLLWPKKEDSAAVQSARDSISQLLEANTIHLMQERTLETRLTQAKVKSRSDSTRFYREITVKNQQLARKRVQIDTLILENPNLASYMETADSVFSLMHRRIDTLEAQKAFSEGLYQQMIFIKDKQLYNLEIVSSQKDIVIKDLEKQARKKNRGNLVLKVLAVTGAVGGLLLGSNL